MRILRLASVAFNNASKGGQIMQNALPRWLRTGWLLLSPIGFLFSARITWEKTILTWTHGPQNVGFTLMHTYPVFGLAGILRSCLLMLWLVLATPYLVRRWNSHSKADILMVFFSFLSTLAVILPDQFFAK